MEISVDNILATVPKHKPKFWLNSTNNFLLCTLDNKDWGASNGSILFKTDDPYCFMNAADKEKYKTLLDRKVDIDFLYREHKQTNAIWDLHNLYQWEGKQILILSYDNRFTFIQFQNFSFFRKNWTGSLELRTYLQNDLLHQKKPVFVYADQKWIGTIMPVNCEVYDDLLEILPRNDSLHQLLNKRTATKVRKGQAKCPCCNHIFEL